MNNVRFKQLYVRSFTAVLLASSLFSCGDSNDENVDVLFEKIESDVTGIDFVNTVFYLQARTTEGLYWAAF